MAALDASRLDRRLVLMARASSQNATYGTTSVEWVPLATVWAEVQDMLPSRAERIADGVSIASRPCRVRIRYRVDVSNDMRLTLDGRSLRIVGGPSELGRREGLEFVAEELSTEGNEP